MADFYEVGVFLVLYSGVVVSSLLITVAELPNKTEAALSKKPRAGKDASLEAAS